MWTETSMTVGQSLVVSLMGITIVLGILSLLAVSLVLFSKVMSLALNRPKAAPAVAQVEETGFLTHEEECAAIISVICEDLETSPENIIVQSIREIK